MWMLLTYAGNLENLKDVENRDNYTFVKANICDKEAIAKIFAENDIDRVVHFAAESHVDRSTGIPRYSYRPTCWVRRDVKLRKETRGSFRTAPLSRARNSCMFRRMKYTAL